MTLQLQVGSLYVSGEEFALQPLDQGARRKRQVRIKTGSDGKKKTTVMYGLFKKEKPNIGNNWEMKKDVKDFKASWDESKL